MNSSHLNASTSTKDEQEIRQLIDAWRKALEAKDPDGLVAHYAPDAVLYDAVPPYKAVGVEEIRKTWECCLPYFPEVRAEHRDLVLHVDGDLAFAYGLQHFVPNPADHECGETWFRTTICYRRIEGRWQAVHEHASLPFDPTNNLRWPIKDPAVLDAPDFGEPET